MAFAYCMFVHVVLVSGSSAVASLCTQGGRFNCLQCAARYGRTELFHHLVQRYDCDPKAKDRNTTVSHSSTRLHRQRCDMTCWCPQVTVTLSCYVCAQCHTCVTCCDPLGTWCVHISLCTIHTCVCGFCHTYSLMVAGLRSTLPADTAIESS